MAVIKKSAIICYVINITVFIGILLWGLLGSVTGNELGYFFLSFFLIMPLSSLITSFVLGIANARFKWTFPFIFGVLSLLIQIWVFGYIAISPLFLCLFFSLIPSLLGLTTGILVKKDKNI